VFHSRDRAMSSIECQSSSVYVSELKTAELTVAKCCV